MSEHDPLIPGDPERYGVDTLRSELAFYRKLVEDLARQNDVQNILNEILRLSLQPAPLDEQLNQILRLILSIEWLALEKKGCFFLKQEGAEALELVSHQNLGEGLLRMCGRVEFGHCLCGKAALYRTLIFKSGLDEAHENRPAGIEDHGHYVVPIMGNGSVLGVLNLYVKHGHVQTESETGFLTSCGHVIAGVIIRQVMEDRLVHLSMHDALTKLPNRRALYQHMQETAERLKRKEQQLALIFVDLDYFKTVNDTHGHRIGDEILITASNRIRDSLGECDFTARLGGDEFVSVVECGARADEQLLRETAERLIESVSEPYAVGNAHVRIGASVGVYICSPACDQAADVEALIMKADKAMYRAKSARGTVHILSANR